MEESAGVRWNAWEPATLARAAAEGKLIFLDISATWCHWCHVLDRTSLSDPRVVRMLNEEYIAVRVDTDRRPDINERYNQGGWPTTAVLLPDGQLLTGATYLPPDALAAVLEKCLDFYRNDRERVDEYLRTSSAAARGEGERGSAPASPRAEDLALVKHAVLAAYDPIHPGFFREPKFPVPDILGFLRDAWAAEGGKEAGGTLLPVLRTMAASGVFDPVEGGFFRYATRRDWSVPHYEKMLAENADLLSLYAVAWERTGEEAFSSAGSGILRFLFARLYDPSTGAFFASQDADEEYYPLPAEGRSLRVPPPVDRTLFSEYNGKAVSALVAAHRAFGAPAGQGAGADSLLARASALGKWLRESLWDPAAGQARYLAPPGEAQSVPRGLLADHVAVSTAYLDLYEETGEDEYLRWAGESLDLAVATLFRESAAGFLDRRPSAGDFGNLAVPAYPFAANAQMACALLRHARGAGRPDHLAVAARTLCGLSGEYDGRGAFSAPYGSALLLYRKGNPGKACLPGDPACNPGQI